MLKVLELFAGIGTCSKALTNLGIEHEIVDAVEIDRFAIKSFNAIHGTDFEAQDISEWSKQWYCLSCHKLVRDNEVGTFEQDEHMDFIHETCGHLLDDACGDVDLIMHGSPCQDFSFAGKQAGGDEGSGTRSSLMYESIRIISRLQPKYVIWENVKAVLSKKHVHNFQNYLNQMTELGYESHYQVLNAKDFGIPQNRERVFVVSIRYDVATNFRFPEPVPLAKRLKDILEPEVDEKYYLSDEKIQRMNTTNWELDKLENVRTQDEVGRTLRATNYKNPQCVRVGGLYDTEESRHQAGSVYSPEGIAATLDTMGEGNREPMIVAMRGRNPENPSDRTSGVLTKQRLEVNNKGVSNTLTSVQKDNLVATIIDDTQGFDGIRKYNKYAPTLRSSRSGLKTVDSHFRIRKLTPKECWRLMGFSDEDFEKANKVNSNTQLYKQAGNSIVVPVLEAILKELLKEK